MAVTLFKVIQLIFENNFNFYIFLAHSRIKMRRSRMDFCVFLLMIFNVRSLLILELRFIATGIIAEEL